LVLDPDGRKYRDAAQYKLLVARSLAQDDVDVCLRSEIALHGFVRRESLLNKSHFGADEIEDAFLRLQRGNEIVTHGEIAAATELWATLRKQAIDLIDAAHKRSPERTGLDLNELRVALRDQPPEVFEALIADLCADEFVRKGSGIGRKAHRLALPVELRSVGRKICEALAKKPFDPPPRREIEADLDAQRVLRFLIETGEVSEVDSDVILLRENFERMRDAIADFISQNGPATVSELRQRLQSSRRIMVPLLERLDREGVTRRVGDKRVPGRIM
jgi:selenocysteine-specific elongation factor